MDWKVIIYTYNVAMRRVSDVALDALFAEVESTKPQLVVIGLQEVAHAETVGGALLTWQKLIIDWLNMRTSMILYTKTYQATNQIMVFGRKNMLPLIHSIQHRFSKNTLGGLTGHKGSIGIRVKLRDSSSLVFVVSHFVHDVAAYERRLQQYESNKYCCYPEDNKRKAIFWLGDLNFRIELEPSEALEMLNSKGVQPVFDSYEQLKKAMLKDQAFSGFQEQEVTFKPSYRVMIGTSEYDLKRTPSWCDRILYCGKAVAPVSYSSLPNVRESDHLPVRGIFDLKLPEQSTKDWDVIFEQLPPWYSVVPLIGRFQFRTNYWSTNGSYMDWVGVFPEPVLDCTSSDKWSWVATCYNQVVDSQKYVVCEFGTLPPGIYRLAYYSNTRNCLIGLSKSFKVTDAPS